MPDRRTVTLAFLQAAGWGDAAHSPLAGDASARHYTRLSRNDTSETAILMDAAPVSGEDVRPFLCVARHLKSLGLSAPEILRKFTETIHTDANEFARAHSILGAQGNLHILGYFARLSVLFGKPRYVGLIPRVWQHLKDNLAHPDLVDLRTSVLDGFPLPNSEFLNSLRSKCPTLQKP